MNTINAKKGVTDVVATDELKKAIESAHARADEVYAGKHTTLIDEISDADWANWDASNERALAADLAGLGDVDDDDDSLGIAA